MRSRIFWPLYLALLVMACKKEETFSPPIVVIESPNADGTLFLPDTVNVSASVSDDVEVKSVRVSLIDAQGFSVGSSFTNVYSSQSVDFNVAFPIIDLDIKTGSHNLRVTASDGESEGSAFVPLNLIEVPRVFKGYIYMRLAGDNSIYTYQIDGGSDVEQVVSGSSSYHAVNHRAGVAYISKDSEGSIEAYTLGESWEAIWAESFPGTPESADVNFMHYDDSTRELIVALDRYGIYAIRDSGVTSGFVSLEPGEEVRDIAVGPTDYWLAIKTDGGQNKLIQVYRETGFRVREIVLNYGITHAVLRTENELVLGTEEGNLEILDINTLSSIPVNIPNEGPIDELHEGLNEVYVRKENSIYRVTSGFQVQGLLQGSDIRSLAIDEVNNRLFSIDGNVLSWFNIFPWVPQGSTQLMSEAERLSLLYNK